MITMIITNAVWIPNTYNDNANNGDNYTEVNKAEMTVLKPAALYFIAFFTAVLVVPFVKAIVIMLIETYQ